MPNSLLSRVFESAWTRSQLEQRYLGVTPAAVNLYQELLSHMVYPDASLRAAPERLLRNELGQSGLWSMGISGDLPLLSVLVHDGKALGLAREVLLAHTYWRLQGFRADLVILNQEAASYDQPLQGNLRSLIQAHSLHTGIDVPGGVFLRDWNALSEQQRNLLLAASRVVLTGARGGLARQLALGADSAPSHPPGVGRDARVYGPSELPFLELDYFNGIGGFHPASSEYCVYLDGGASTPQPWVNVIAGPSFGAMVTESGLGFTWAGNSQANRLTPWRNDPVSDDPSEVVYLRDDDTGEYWSVTARPCGSSDAYRARHGFGYTVFEHNHNELDQELTVFLAPDPVKLGLLRIRNRSRHARRLSVITYAEWVLGVNREEGRLHLRCFRDDQTGALFARNNWTSLFPGATAFLAMSPEPSSFTTDRTRFLGRNGSYHWPLALNLPALDGRQIPGQDPCGVLCSTLTVQPDQTATVVTMLGQASNFEHARELARRYAAPEKVQQALESTRTFWRSLLATIQVDTPIHSVNLLLNGWLNYQSLSCRFWGRSAYYQSGGAFGFRDQLQDCMGLVYLSPPLAREHILRAASRQYLEGDVQHWWHPETGMGVRSRCSDDLFWLPYATAHYVSITGDLSILQEQVTFLSAPELEQGHLEQLQEPRSDPQPASLLEHCLRALRHSEVEGPHGLPLMGSGDWNDGMNLVGGGGRGESVWLAWFLVVVLRDFAALLRRVGEPAQAQELADRASKILAAAEQHCWDGEWYVRAFFDDGSPLGSHQNQEARIDSIAQSWAVMAGADPARVQTAVHSALRELVDEEHGIVRLFWPPFRDSQPHPGYIMGYPAGLRENGGQYTHGSLWLALACARLGKGGDAVRLLQLMNPIEKTRDPESSARYGGEPYVVAADVYAAKGQEGRSGWTWYTGSASWMYRIWLESVLGFELRGDSLTIRPEVPDTWDRYSITYRHGQATYQVEVRRRPIAGVELDGKPAQWPVSLSRGPGQHRINVYF